MSSRHNRHRGFPAYVAKRRRDARNVQQVRPFQMRQHLIRAQPTSRAARPPVPPNHLAPAQMIQQLDARELPLRAPRPNLDPTDQRVPNHIPVPVRSQPANPHRPNRIPHQPNQIQRRVRLRPRHPPRVRPLRIIRPQIVSIMLNQRLSKRNQLHRNHPQLLILRVKKPLRLRVFAPLR